MRLTKQFQFYKSTFEAYQWRKQIIKFDVETIVVIYLIVVNSVNDNKQFAEYMSASVTKTFINLSLTLKN